MSHLRASAVLSSLVAGLAEELQAGVRPALADQPDAVHHLRTVVRRLRGVLAAFDRCFDGSATAPLVQGLVDCGARLGVRRDAEVRLADAGRAVECLHLSADDAALLTEDLEQAGRRAQADLVDWAHGPAARQVVDRLAAWAADPAFTPGADRRATKVLQAAVQRERRRVVDRAALMTRGDAVRAHEVRKAARRLRHVAEAAAPYLPKEQRRSVVVAGRLGRDVQGALGDQRDAELLARRAAEVGLDRVAAWSQEQAAGALLGLPAAFVALARDDRI